MNNKTIPILRGPVSLINADDDTIPCIFDGRAVLKMVNRGYTICDRIGRFGEFEVRELQAATRFSEALDGFILIAHGFCGDAYLALDFEKRELAYENVREVAIAASRDVGIHELLMGIAHQTFKTMNEYDDALKVWSVEEVSVKLYHLLIGKHRLAEAMAFALNVLEGRSNKIGMRRMHRFFGSEHFDVQGGFVDKAEKSVGRALPVVEEMVKHGNSFTEMVIKLKAMMERQKIAPDALAAVALAELGYVLQCEPPSKHILLEIARKDWTPFWGWTTLTSVGSSWLAPFKSFEADRRVLALNGRTWLRPTNVANWMSPSRGGNYASAQPPAAQSARLLESFSFPYIEKVDARSLSALCDLRNRGNPWNDELESQLGIFDLQGIPLAGVESCATIRTAREVFTSAVSWRKIYSEAVFSTPHVIAAYVSAKQEGSTLGLTLYHTALSMFHPHQSRMRERELQDYLTGLCKARDEEDWFISDLKQYYFPQPQHQTIAFPD